MVRSRPLDPADHLGRPWRVHALARAEGLALHDVWEVDAALPPGATLGQWADAWRRERQSAAKRALFAVRWGLGCLLSLDRGSPGFTLLYAEAEEIRRSVITTSNAPRLVDFAVPLQRRLAGASVFPDRAVEVDEATFGL